MPRRRAARIPCLCTGPLDAGLAATGLLLVTPVALFSCYRWQPAVVTSERARRFIRLPPRILRLLACYVLYLSCVWFC